MPLDTSNTIHCFIFIHVIMVVEFSILVVVGQFSMLEGSANRLDTEQEREQEQEQEKEVEARRDQQIEVEKFVDREYSRQEEVQRPWPFSMLAKDIYTPGIEHPFYKLCDFKLRHQDSLAFDETLFLSSNYFNPNWTGLRRVKNVVMLLEYAPSTDISELRLRTSEEARVVLTADQEIALRKAHSLLGFHANLAGRQDVLNRTDIRNAVGAVLDIKEPAESLIDEIITRFSSDKEYVTLDEFREILACGFLYPKHKGRNWVAVSLAEAETIRRILHLRKRCDNQHIIPNSSTELALRYSPISGQTGPQYVSAFLFTINVVIFNLISGCWRWWSCVRCILGLATKSEWFRRHSLRGICGAQFVPIL